MAEGEQLQSEDWARLFDPDIPSAAHRLLLDSGADIYDAADAIEGLFGAVPEVDAVAVWIGDRLEGHTSRAHIARIFPAPGQPVGSAERGFGDGDGLHLPGLARFAALRYDCPRCGQVYWLIGVAPGEPPTCSDDGQLLEHVR
ncbi:hypothetical protein [Nocardia lijiangensis]|uniref:hypothetical protein n=1 Tax=Nocardia lijiangensis TaxID=299618 RepID=UPI0008297794|nr:hypothetical protein [Nocardia lijiangensis]